MQAREAGGVGEQRDRVGGDGEAHPARLVVAPVEAEAAVLAALDQRAGARPPARRRSAAATSENSSGSLLARERGEDAVQRGAQAAGELELLGAAGPARDARGARPSGPASPASSSASVAAISCSSSVQSTELAKSSAQRAALQLDRFGGYPYH